MKKKLNLRQALFIMLFTAVANAQVSQEWLRRYDFNETGTSDIATAIAIDAQNNLYVTGSGGALGNPNIITIKYDPAGQIVWTRVWNGPGNSYDGANAITVKGNAVYITGFTEVPPQINSNRRKDFATLKYNLDGTLLWAAFYNFSPTSNWEDIAYAVDVDDLNNVYVTGSSKTAQPQNGYRDIATIKYSPSGLEQWVARYNYPDAGGTPGTSDDIPVALKVDAAGNVYVTGGSVSSVSGFDYVTLKYDTNGVNQWENRYTMPGTYADYPAALKLDADANVYITGGSSGYGVDPLLWDDYATIKYNSNGEELWVRRFNSSPSANSVASDDATDLVVDNDGNVYVTGSSPSLSPTTYGDDFYTIKYDSSGTVLWESRWDAQRFEDNPKKMALDADANVYITGFSTNPDGTQNYATIKLSSSGQFQWSQSYQESAGSQHFANGIVVDSDANVYVTGQSYLFGDDYVTIKYAQQPLSVAENQVGTMVLYPNPASGFINLKNSASEDQYDITITNLLGQQLQKITGKVFAAGELHVEISDLPAGLYIMSIESGQSTTAIKFQKH